MVYVIDGVIVEAEVFQNLDPNNIANINVLKGASASALYGSRGRYGAVLITTKNAKKQGDASQWKKLINSFRLKILITLSKKTTVGGINIANEFASIAGSQTLMASIL